MSMDIADWLRRLGLEQYAPAFAANDIETEILPELTAEDLAGLGVTSIGHRRKLLAAIAGLRAEASDSANPLPNPPLPGLGPGITGEGRVGAEAEASAHRDVLRSGRLDSTFSPV